jgi:hypothetical protein
VSGLRAVVQWGVVSGEWVVGSGTEGCGQWCRGQQRTVGRALCAVAVGIAVVEGADLL